MLTLSIYAESEMYYSLRGADVFASGAFKVKVNIDSIGLGSEKYNGIGLLDERDTHCCPVDTCMCIRPDDGEVFVEKEKLEGKSLGKMQVNDILIITGNLSTNHFEIKLKRGSTAVGQAQVHWRKRQGVVSVGTWLNSGWKVTLTI